MSTGDVIIVLIVALLVILAVNNIRKGRNKCSCGCQSCRYGSNCSKRSRGV